jgi:hypothetical protein
MTYLDLAYRYHAPPAEKAMRALNAVSEVYGIQKIEFKDKDRVISVRFDASRLTQEAVEGLLRQAGIAIEERVALA